MIKMAECHFKILILVSQMIFLHLSSIFQHPSTIFLHLSNYNLKWSVCRIKNILVVTFLKILNTAVLFAFHFDMTALSERCHFHFDCINAPILQNQYFKLFLLSYHSANQALLLNKSVFLKLIIHFNL